MKHRIKVQKEKTSTTVIKYSSPDSARLAQIDTRGQIATVTWQHSSLGVRHRHEESVRYTPILKLMAEYWVRDERTPSPMGYGDLIRKSLARDVPA